MARQPQGLAGAGGAARAVRVRRARDLRRRRHLRARPARWRSTPASSSRACAPRSTTSATSAAAAARGRALGARSSASRAPACGPVAPSAVCRAARALGVARAFAERRAGPRLPARDAARRVREAAGDRARGRGRRLHARLRQPDLRTARAARRRGRSLPEAMVEVSARAGAAGLDPGRRRPATAAACRGARRGSTQGHELMANRTVEALWRWSGEGELPGRDRRQLLRARPRRRGRARADARRTASATAKLSVLDSVAWAHDRLLPELDVDADARLGRGPPDLLDPPPGPGAASCAALAGAIADEVAGPDPRHLLRHGGRPRPAAPRAAPASATAERGRGAGGPRPRRLPVAATAPARSACSRGPARPTSRSLLALERATR